MGIQPLIAELVQAVRLQCAQEFTAFIPKVVEAVRLQCAQEFQTFIPIMVEEMKKVVHSSSLRSSPDQAESSVSRSLQLHLVGSLPTTLHTMTKIQDAGASLVVELRDSSGSRVEIGPESSAKVKLVVLDGDFEVDGNSDWTKEEFDKNVVKPRKDKGPLLKGKSDIRLIKGVAVVSDIAFTDNSKSMRNGTFRLGAELVNGTAREAVSKDAFMVKERRLIISNQRRLSLEDDTCHLKHIGDTNTQNLAKAKVLTVKDFLQLYHTDAKALRKVLRISDNKLSETVKIAESCPLTKECYTYYDDTERADLVLDCVFNVKSITFKGQTSQAYEILDDSLKELVDKLRCNAYERREELPKTCTPTNQVSLEVDPVAASIIQPTTMQYADSPAENQGKQMVEVNNLVPYSFRYDNGYQLGPPISQIEDLDPDQWEWDNELVTDLASLLEETGTQFEASESSNDHITGKLKAACYMTKAAIMLMVSIQQQDSTAPRKKRKMTLLFNQAENVALFKDIRNI